GAPLAELQQQDLIFPVIECRLRYRAPARYDDLLAIELWIAGMQGVRLTFAYRITNAENRLPLVEAETVHVCATCQEKPCRLPGDLAAKLQPYLRASAPGMGCRRTVFGSATSLPGPAFWRFLTPSRAIYVREMPESAWRGCRRLIGCCSVRRVRAHSPRQCQPISNYDK